MMFLSGITFFLFGMMKVKNITKDLAEQKRRVNLPLHLKHMVGDEILQLLKSLPENANVTEQRGEKRTLDITCYI